MLYIPNAVAVSLVAASVNLTSDGDDFSGDRGREVAIFGSFIELLEILLLPNIKIILCIGLISNK